jgi:hypothetical protein
MAWLTGWEYRKSVPLSRVSGAVTDYQMKLLVGESSGAVGEDVDCNSHCRTDFGDLRFTTSDGETVLNYWVESVSGTSPNQLATVWIKFDSIGIGNTTFYMYYGKISALLAPADAPNTGKWVRPQTTPVLPVGAGGSWDAFWVQIHSIVKVGSTYYAYYGGAANSSVLWKIGLATSPDGITWTKSGSNPVLDVGGVGEWDHTRVNGPCVWYEDGTFYMLYAGENTGGADWAVGLATSPDGVVWTKYGSNPVMTKTALAWDSYFVSPGTMMLKEEGTYYFYYWGGTSSNAGNGNWKIGLATSTDLHMWTKSGNNPLLSPAGTTWEQGAVCEPCVLNISGTYYMWYQGNNSGGSRSRLGMASSSSKDSGWSEYVNNPVLDAEPDSATAGTSGVWDDQWCESPVVIQWGASWRLYYSGSQGSAATPRMQSGYAVYYYVGSGTNTFILFDDFHGLTLNSALWNDLDAFVLDQDCIQKYASNTNTSYKCKSQNTKTGPLAIRAKIKLGSDWANEYGILFMVNFDSDWSTSGYAGAHYKDASNDLSYVRKDPGNVSSTTTEALSGNTWYLLDLLVGAATQKCLYNGIQKGSISTVIPTNPTNIMLGTSRAASGSAFTVYFDWIFVRKYLDTEPVWGSWESEEEAPPPPPSGGGAYAFII